MTDTTETEQRDTMRDHLNSLLERASSTDPDDALTSESVLALDISGKYVNVLFSTGGPHTEMTFEYEDADDADYWFEMTPVGAWFTYKDWFVRQDVWVGGGHAEKIASAISRSYEEMAGEDQ